MLKRLGHIFFSPREFEGGIAGMKDIKFYLVFVLYLAAFLALAYDPFFLEYGVFSYKQGVVPLMLGFIIISAINWEFLLFGKPAGANLFLQLMQLFPFSLLCARMLAKPSQPPIPKDTLGLISNFISGTFAQLFSWMPNWISDIFANWQVSLLIAGILLVFCLRVLEQKIAILVLLFFMLIANGLSEMSIYLILGVIFLISGGWVQFCQYRQVVFFENVIRKLRSTPKCDEIFVNLVCRIMTSINDRKKINEETLLQLVKSEYSNIEQYSMPELKIIASEVSRKLFYEYNLVELQGTQDGMFLCANPKLYSCDGLLLWVSVVPRMAIVAFLALFWIFSPIDIIPDTLPLIGVLDDVTIGIMAAIVIKGSALSEK